MGLLTRLRRRLRPDAPSGAASDTTAGHTTAHTELGSARLPDGTVLERCVLASAADLRSSLAPGRDRLLFVYRAADPASAHDLHELRELHLYYSKHADLVSIAADLQPGSPAAAAGLAVDAFHRDHGLTWQSLLYDGAAGPLHDLLGLDPGLPQVSLLAADGSRPFHRVGPWLPGDRQHLELLLTDRA